MPMKLNSSRVIVALAVLAGLVASLGLAAVITAGFTLSFDAIGAVGRACGVRDEIAWLLPAAVDGAMSVGTVTAVVVRRLHRSTAYPWTVVSVHLLVTLVDALVDTLEPVAVRSQASVGGPPSGAMYGDAPQEVHEGTGSRVRWQQAESRHGAVVAIRQPAAEA
ncbi:DUF2637 domain-containing protein [Actinomadura fulvescens]